MKVLFLTNVPSPYRVNFFNELGKSCDLTVVFEKAASDERDKSWDDHSFANFKGIVLNGKKTSTDKAFAPSVKEYLKGGEYDRTVVCNASTPTGMYAMQYMIMHKIPYMIEGDGAFPKQNEGFKKHIKQHFIKNAAGYFSTCPMHDEYYIQYGADEKKIIRYPFTSVFEKDIISAPQTKEEKEELKKELGMTEKKAVLTVGQFIPRKGFDVLLRSAAESDPDTGFWFIGGNPGEEYLELAGNNEHIHFVGFKKPSELRRYYMASELFVLPTREDIWGLVINEAMACGLPVISTDRCNAALELVRNGENGFTVPAGDEKSLAEKINLIVGDEEMQSAMAQKSLEIIKDYTIEKMAGSHLDTFNGK